ncbi:MAG: hypothetical protein HYZ26_12985 [Chloroflexi bacterium]|nr:hypothetical protein [Chloroflexota bacterium]
MFRNGFIFRLAGVLFLIVLLAAGGYIAYQAGAAQGGGPGLGIGTPFGLFGALCLSGLFLFVFLGALTLTFCPFRKRGRMNTQEYDSN